MDVFRCLPIKTVIEALVMELLKLKQESNLGAKSLLHRTCRTLGRDMKQLSLDYAQTGLDALILAASMESCFPQHCDCACISAAR